jgi:hypothetical protein
MFAKLEKIRAVFCLLSKQRVAFKSNKLQYQFQFALSLSFSPAKLHNKINNEKINIFVVRSFALFASFNIAIDFYARGDDCIGKAFEIHGYKYEYMFYGASSLRFEINWNVEMNFDIVEVVWPLGVMMEGGKLSENCARLIENLILKVH